MNFLEDITAKRIKLNPELPAIIGKNEVIAYRELIDKTYALTEFLSDQKVIKNEPVAILSDNNPDFIILVLALWMLDAVPVPLNTRLTQNEIQQQIEIAGCRKIFIHSNFKNDPLLSSIDRYNFPPDLKPGGNDRFSSEINLENTAVVIFTSGSTGMPKGVMLSFNNLIRSAEIGNRVLQQDSKDRWLCSLPFFHIGGFSIITRALLYSASLIIPASLETEDLTYSFKNQEPTFASLVGTQLKRLIDSGLKPGKGLQSLLLGGGFVHNDLVLTAINNGWKISKVYGSSETSSFVTLVTGNELLQNISSSGKALPPNEILIKDQNGEILPAGKSGEIVVKSDAVMKGYINNREESGAKLKDGFYYSGDIGHLDDKGYLYVEARRSDLIISGGENINPMEVQNSILENQGVKECFVFGLEDKTWGQIVAAAVVKKEKGPENINLAEFLRPKLAGYKIPKKIIFVNQLPVTPLGKVEKDKVKELFN